MALFPCSSGSSDMESPSTQPTVTYTGTDAQSHTVTVNFYKMGDLKIVKLALTKFPVGTSGDGGQVILSGSFPTGYEPNGTTYFVGCTNNTKYRAGVAQKSGTNGLIRIYYSASDTDGGFFGTCIYI